MFQVRFPDNRWQSCLNDVELETHLVLANNSSGDLMYQQSKSQSTRHFLKSILEGKGLEATCTYACVLPLSFQSMSSHHAPLFTQTLANSNQLWFQSTPHLWYYELSSTAVANPLIEANLICFIRFHSVATSSLPCIHICNSSSSSMMNLYDEDLEEEEEEQKEAISSTSTMTAHHTSRR